MKKSKWDILGQDIDRVNNQEYDDWFNYWYDGDYYDYNYDEDYDYEYTEKIYNEYISKRGIRVTLDRILMGGYIDMMSIYSSQVLRQRKIDYLLGIDIWEITKLPTIGDLIKNKKENEN